MFRALFFTTLLVTLTVNIIFLFAAKDKPPDPTAATPTRLESAPPAGGAGRPAGGGRRLFLRSNDFYDYSAAAAGPSQPEGPTNENQSSQSSVSPSSSSSWFLQGGGDLSRAQRRQSDESTAAGGPAGRAATRRSLAQERRVARKHEPAEIVVGQSLAPPAERQEISDDNETRKRGPAAPGPRRRISGEPAEGPPEEGEHDKHTNGQNDIRQAPPGNNNNNNGDNDPGQELGNASFDGNASPSGPGGQNSTRAEITTSPAIVSPRPNNTQTAHHQPNQHEHHPGWRRPANTTRPLTGARLNIRVKSSKNHVLVRVDNLIIYESGYATPKAPGDDDKTTPSLYQVRRMGSPTSRRAANANKQMVASSDGTPSARPDRETITTTRQAQYGDDDDQRTSQNNHPDDSMRGIHVLVLNQHDGRLMARRLFDTYSAGQDDELALFLRQIQEGRLLVMAVQDEASFKMARSSQARKLIQRLGSRQIPDLGWRDTWALVTVKQLSPASQSTTSRALAEGLGKSVRFTEWAPQVEIETTFQLSGANQGDDPDQCPFEGDSHEVRERRREFCARIEGYGRVCDCKFPARLEFSASRRPMENNQIWDVPIVVVASNRPYYLYRMLNSLLSAQGVDPKMVTVFIDGFYDEPKWLCKLLNVRYVQHAPRGTRSARISHHYKTSLSMTFERLFPLAKAAIIFEEDLDVARDALVYFNQTRGLLERDPSLYCVSAWNDQGYEHSVGNASQLLRIETMPGLGWMLTRRLFMEELKPRWPSWAQQHDWDMWIRTQAVRRNRECIIPDVSRTYHFGSTGTNINSYFQRQYFSKHAFSGYDDNDESSYTQSYASGGVPATKFADVDSLERDNYERLIEAKLDPEKSPYRIRVFSQPSDHLGENHDPRIEILAMSSEALCSYSSYDDQSYSPASNKSEPAEQGGERQSNEISLDAPAAKPKADGGVNVIFIKMIDSEDFGNWLKLARCWRLWDLDARGQHKSMWRLYLRGRQTFVIGHPASPYGRFKPAQLLPYEIPGAAAA